MIIQQICDNKKHKIDKLGFTLGHKIPRKRKYPLITPSLDTPLLIAEIKRKSPAKGVLDSTLNPLQLAKSYLDSGVGAISVLCEEDYFNGSLQDLMDIKSQFPNATLLRKDFILYKEEIEISYRAGADMVLLIASIFIDNPQLFDEILKCCDKFGILPLVEIHNEKEFLFVRNFNIQLLGINSRDLRNFKIDKFATLSLKAAIAPSIKVIFESGIHSPFDAYLAGSCGFSGILCGEYLIKSQDKKESITSLAKSLHLGISAYQANGFYRRFFALLKTRQPIVKICGITNLEDANLVKENGADMIGFILSPSARQIKPEVLKEISRKMRDMIKIGVILENEADLIQAREYVDSQIIDCIQLHNAKNSSVYANYALNNANFAFYQGFNIGAMSDIPTHYLSPFILLDSQSESQGGSGKMIAKEILLHLSDGSCDNQHRLCISGGISEENIDFFLSLNPQMLDICSSIESTKGKKDKAKLQRLMQIIKERR